MRVMDGSLARLRKGPSKSRAKPGEGDQILERMMMPAAGRRSASPEYSVPR